MLVSDVKKFIRKCTDYHKITQNDDKIQSLLEIFLNREDEEELNQTDQTSILNWFEKRFVPDSNTDYTKDSNSNANKACIEFSKKIAPLLNKTYLNVLFPNVTNDLDPCDSSKLVDVANPVLLFLDNSNKILYSKTSYMQYLENHGFELSVPNNIPNTNAKPLSIKVLARIKASKLAEGGVKSDHFSLWDYLKKEEGASESNFEASPENFLGDLSKLINVYFNLKNSNEPFTCFKDQFENFKSLLENSTPSAFTNFCRAWVGKQDNREYLLDYLIDIELADNYTLDEDFSYLNLWLYEYDPSYVVNETLQTNSNTSSSINLTNLGTSRSSNDIHPLYDLLLRVFTAHFPKDCSKFYLWDMENSIPTNMCSLFITKDLNQVIKDNKPEKIQALYESIKNAHFNIEISASSQQAFFQTKSVSLESYLNDSSSIKCLYPEVLLMACVKFQSTNSQLNTKLHEFIDNIIRTYSQVEQLDLMVLRVNYLYVSLLNEIEVISPTDMTSLNSSVIKYEYIQAKNGFLEMATKYILGRLFEKGALNDQDKIQLQMLLTKSPSGANNLPVNMSSLLANLSNQITTYTKKNNLMIGYLLDLKTVILSKDNIDNINNSSNDNINSVGSPFS